MTTVLTIPPNAPAPVPPVGITFDKVGRLATSATRQARRCRDVLRRDVLPHLAEADLPSGQRVLARIERRAIFCDEVSAEVAELAVAITRAVEARTTMVPIHRGSSSGAATAEPDWIERRMSAEGERLVVARRELDLLANLLEQVLDAMSAEAALAALRAKR